MDIPFDELVKLVEARDRAMQTSPAQFANKKRNETMNEPFPSSAPPVIDIRRLTRHFGNKTALDDVSLTVPRGGVFGLIGGNGAGKTTLIKHILGMLKAETGTVQVFGLDPVRNPVGTLGRIGYLSEDRDLPNWMRSRRAAALHASLLSDVGRSLCRGTAAGFRPRRQGPNQDAVAGPAGAGGFADGAGASARAACVR